MQAELYTLFSDVIEAFAAGKGIPVAFENVPFEQPPKPAQSTYSLPGNAYLKVAELPVTPSVHGVNNGESDNRSVLQISIYLRDGLGKVVSGEIADEIRNSVFPIHSKLVGANHTYQVITPPNPVPSIPMDGWHSTPVRFQVQTIH